MIHTRSARSFLGPRFQGSGHTGLAWFQTCIRLCSFPAPPTAASSGPCLGSECSELTVCPFQVSHGFLSPQRPPSTETASVNHTLTDATKLQVTQRRLSKQCQATAQNSLALRSNEPCPARATSSRGLGRGELNKCQRVMSSLQVRSDHKTFMFDLNVYKAELMRIHQSC